MIVIGIAGPAGAGKDTVADHIVERTGAFVKVSFATRLKKMLKVGLDLTDQQLHGDLKETLDPRYGKTPRHIMQTLGTEWGRHTIADDIWPTALFAALDREYFDAGPERKFDNIVIADVRFANEAAAIRERGGFIVHLEGRSIGLGSTHASEAGVGFKSGDEVIYNSENLEALAIKCKPVLDRIYQELESCDSI